MSNERDNALLDMYTKIDKVIRAACEKGEHIARVKLPSVPIRCQEEIESTLIENQYHFHQVHSANHIEWVIEWDKK